MAEVSLTGITKRFGAETAVADHVPHRSPTAAFVVLLGPTGAGKTTTLRLIAGLERADAGRIRDRRARCEGGDAGRARRRHGLPAILALSAYERAREPGLPPPLAHPPPARGGDRAQGRRGGRGAAHLPQARQPRHGAVRRRDAARLHRPGPGAPSRDLSDGRAALLARRQAARRAAGRAEAHPAGSRRHAALCHPRPDRGDDHGHRGRRARPRPPGPVRHAAR